MKKNVSSGTPDKSKSSSDSSAVEKKLNAPTKRALDEAALDQVRGGTGQIEQQIQDRLKEAQQGMHEGSQYNDVQNFKASSEAVEVDAQGGNQFLSSFPG